MAATLRASEAGLQKVDLARRKKGWNKSQQEWWQLAASSESTLKRFWKRDPISAETFKDICKTVGIDDWEAIADFSLAEPNQEPDQSHGFLFGSYDPNTFTGRDDEIAQLSQALHTSKQLLVIHGLTGIGKTTLAECIAAEFANPKFYHRIDWSHGAQSFIQAALTILEKLNDTTAQKLPDAEILPYLQRKLEQSPYWLQFDSLEYVLSPTDQGNSHFADPTWLDFLTQILQSSRHRQLRLILTSQVLPSDLSHHLLRYEALWYSLPLDGLSLDQRLDLFRHCGIQAQNPEEKSYLCAIADFFAGHPLILKMIAADISAKPFNGDITKYWQDYYQPRQTQPNLKLHQSQEDRARNWIRQTLQHLPELPRQMLQRCAVFRRPVSDAFYLAMVQDLTTHPKPVLVTLLDRNLVETDFQAGQRILRQHNLIRSVAYDLLKADQPTWEAAERQAAHLWLHHYKPAPDAPNIETVRGYLEAFEHYFSLEDWDLAKVIPLTIVNGLTENEIHFQLGRWGYYREQIYLYKKLLHLYQSIDVPFGEWFAWHFMGLTYESCGQYKQALECYQNQLNFSCSIEKFIDEQKSALANLIRICNLLGESKKASLYLEKLSRLNLGSNSIQSKFLNSMFQADILSASGEYDMAIGYRNEQLHFAHEANDIRGEIVALNNLGFEYMMLGDYKGAIKSHSRALALANSIKDRYYQASSLVFMGHMFNILKEYGEAIKCYEEALKTSIDMGDRQGESGSLCYLGNTYSGLKQHKKAISFYQQSLTIARESDDKRSQGNSLVNIGATQLKLGQYPESLVNNQAALAIFRETGIREGIAVTLKNLAELHHALGEIEVAKDYCQQALSLATELGIPLKAQCYPLRKST